jgi:hypothetical protein
MLKDDGEDRNGGPLYSKYERVRVESVWRERLRKEVDKHELGSNFQMNLMNRTDSSGLLTLKHSHNRIEIVTEKEHKQSPQARMSIAGMDPGCFEVQAIRHIDKKPTQKNELPLTSSCSVGWLLSKPTRSKHIDRRRAPAPLASTIPILERGQWRSMSESRLLSGEPAPELKMLNSQRWFRPRGQSDVTKYAENYVATLHHNPFNKALAGR